MAIRQIKPNVYYVGSLDWNKKLFDALIPLPNGTSYNSYLITGSEKTALIDTVDFHKKEDLIHNLSELKVTNIDYIVANHAEQDHSGLIPEILDIYPNAKVVSNAKCIPLLREFFALPDDKLITVNDKDTLSLGDKTLEFILAPWVHWPDTMFTYIREDKILFTTDFLGAHYASSSLFVDNEAKVYDAAKRYFAQIMMPFRSNAKNHLGKLSTLAIDIIAPSHGPIHNDPKFILDAYKDWTSDTVKNEVVIPYVSMHGSTEKMVSYLTDKLIHNNLTVKPFDLVSTDIGELAMSLVDAATIIIGTPAVLTGAHPHAVYATYLVNALRPKTKFVSVIGSYGWGCNMLDNLKKMLPNLKAEFLEPVIIKGYPDKKDFSALDQLVNDIIEKHEELFKNNM